MDFVNFLQAMVADSFPGVVIVSGTVGVLVFGIIELVDKLVKNSNPAGMPSQFKFWLAIALAFAVPVVSYVLLQLQTSQPIALNGLFLACAVGYMVSQGIHRVIEGKPEKEAPGGIT